jgi:hypothetical protein
MDSKSTNPSLQATVRSRFGRRLKRYVGQALAEIPFVGQILNVIEDARVFDHKA